MKKVLSSVLIICFFILTSCNIGVELNTLPELDDNYVLETFENLTDTDLRNDTETSEDATASSDSEDIDTAESDTDAESDRNLESDTLDDTELYSEDAIEYTESDSEPYLETETIHDPDHDFVDVDENYYCDICGILVKEETESENETESLELSDEVPTETETETDPPLLPALFDKFYDKNFDLESKKESNGGKMTEKNNTYYSSGYVLKFENYSCVYKNARDSKGNPVLKVGKGDAVGVFSFTVPKDVTTVIFRIARYKDKESAVMINGKEYILTKNSSDGKYEKIIIDTSAKKTILLTTIADRQVCMIRSIEFTGG